MTKVGARGDKIAIAKLGFEAHPRTKVGMVFLKYFSALTILTAICLHSLNIHPLNIYVHLIGACTWSVVGFVWKENSIILNFLPQIFILGGGLLYNYLF